jgi:hypothetical protein
MVEFYGHGNKSQRSLEAENFLISCERLSAFQLSGILLIQNTGDICQVRKESPIKTHSLIRRSPSFVLLHYHFLFHSRGSASLCMVTHVAQVS